MNRTNRKTEYLTNDAIVKQIAASIAGLDYGNILVKIHDAKIVQIEVTQRKRFDEYWNIEKGGGI
jgi:hypothetical protein